MRDQGALSHSRSVPQTLASTILIVSPLRIVVIVGCDLLKHVRRERVFKVFSDIALEGSATSEMTGWAERRPGVARL